MKYKTRLIFLSLGMGLLTLGSCEKFFSPNSEVLLPEDENYSDYLSSRASVNGLYALMQDVMEAYIVNGELKGDMLVTSSGASWDLQQIYDRQFALDNPYLDILPFYRLIANANDVIQHLEVSIEEGTSYDDELLNMYAEAVVLRTWVYFYLARNYTEVPYLTSDYSASESNEPIEDWLAENASTMVSMDKLINDAEGVIDWLDPTGYSSSEFFNVASANALIGEMYLWINDFEPAIEALMKSAASADYYRFILDSDQERAKWQNIFNGDESAVDEIMTKIVFDKGEKQENTLLDFFSSISAFGSQLLPVDQSINNLKDTYRFDGTFQDNEEISKYTRSLDNPYTSDMPVILYRAADVHLMLAEAYNRNGEIQLALDLVNDGNDSLFTAYSKGVRGRVDLDPIEVKGESFQDSILDLEIKILEERSMELAFEGKRWYDLIRIAARRDDPDMLVSLMVKKYPDVALSELEAFYGNPENWYITLQ